MRRKAIAVLAVACFGGCGHRKESRANDAAAEAGIPAPDSAAEAGLPDAGVESGLPPEPACDGAVPPCVDPVPSYSLDVAPIFAAKCNNCHSPEPDKPWPFDTYLNVFAWAADIASSLALCTMPPTDGGTPPLTPAEHQTITNWLACLAPDN